MNDTITYTFGFWECFALVAGVLFMIIGAVWNDRPDYEDD